MAKNEIELTNDWAEHKKQIKNLTKCIFCNNDLTMKDVILSSSGWVYCKKCKHPILNSLIQEEKHWSKKLKKVNAIDLMMDGYC